MEKIEANKRYQIKKIYVKNMKKKSVDNQFKKEVDSNLSNNPSLICFLEQSIINDLKVEITNNNNLFSQLLLAKNESYKNISSQITNSDQLVEDIYVVNFFSDKPLNFDKTKPKDKFSICFFEGFYIKKNDTYTHYVRFERSASMVKNREILFIKECYYDEMLRRISMDLQCPVDNQSKIQFPWLDQDENNGLILSKYNAYKGLSLTDGYEVNFDNKKIKLNMDSVVVVDDCIIKGMPPTNHYWTMENDSQTMLKQCREAMEINAFDGEGLVSPEMANFFREILTQKNVCSKEISSFQIRMPFIKGVIHEVNFKEYLKDRNIIQIVDAFNQVKEVSKIHIIINISMFKGNIWFRKLYHFLKVNNNNHHIKDLDINDIICPWELYFNRFEEYKYHLLITGYTQIENNLLLDRRKFNYQVLNTSGLNLDQYETIIEKSFEKLKKLEQDEYQKQKFLSYVKPKIQTDEEFIFSEQHHNLDEEKNFDLVENTEYQNIGMCIELNENILNTHYIQNIINNEKINIVKNFSLGRLLSEAHVKYLSSDLGGYLFFLEKLNSINLKKIVDSNNKTDLEQYLKTRQVEMIAFFENESIIAKDGVFIPSFRNKTEQCVIFRNPHIARNELCLLHFTTKEDKKENKYINYNIWFSHLKGMVMVNPLGFAEQRAGGADFDGDLIQIVQDESFIMGVREGIKKELIWLNNLAIDKKETDFNEMPITKIPTKPAKKVSYFNINSSKESYDKMNYEEFLMIIGNNIGKYSNMAFEYATRAYGIHEEDEEKDKIMGFCIIIGQEIDAAKTGQKPKMPYEEYEKGLFLTLKEEYSKNSFIPLNQVYKGYREKKDTFTGEKMSEFSTWIDSNLNESVFISYLDKLPLLIDFAQSRNKSNKKIYERLGEIIPGIASDKILEDVYLKKIKKFEEIFNAIKTKINLSKSINKKYDSLIHNKIMTILGEQYEINEVEIIFWQCLQWLNNRNVSIKPQKFFPLLNKIQKDKFSFIGDTENEDILSEYLPIPSEKTFSKELDDLGKKYYLNFNFGGHRLLELFMQAYRRPYYFKMVQVFPEDTMELLKTWNELKNFDTVKSLSNYCRDKIKEVFKDAFKSNAFDEREKIEIFVSTMLQVSSSENFIWKIAGEEILCLLKIEKIYESNEKEGDLE